MQALAPRSSHVASGSGRARSVRQVAARAAATKPAVDTEYEVTLPKPIGVRFGRGSDGRAYVIATDETLGNTDPAISVGDKVTKISASFGTEIWDATGYGQVMYGIKTRNGDVYLKLLARGGDMSVFDRAEETEAERMWRTERGGGNYGAGTKEIQERNYIAMREAERRRREMFEDALLDFRAGKVKEALLMFEDVKAMEPEKYIGDNFERVSRIYVITQYNIACCYSMLKESTPALEALEDCMACGFEDYSKIRKDPNLAHVRTDERFKQTMDKYDEPILNENALNAIKGLFSFGKK